jgi:neurabin
MGAAGMDSTVVSAASPSTSRKFPHLPSSAKSLLFGKFHPTKDLTSIARQHGSSVLDVKVSEVPGWTCDDVCDFIGTLGLDKHRHMFTVNLIDGPKFLALDGSKLKAMGVSNSNERSLVKKKIKELKAALDRERKAAEKDQKRQQQHQKQRSSSAGPASRKRVG